MKISKIEHHSVNWYYYTDIDENTLSEIYPDLTDEEIEQKMEDLKNGDITIDEVIEDAWENDVEILWEFDQEDVWTDRKGGYDITYNLED